MEAETSMILVELQKNWIDIFSALLVPTIALVGIIVAILQWSTNRNRLKHELFDRRYRVFSTTKDFLGYILRNGNMTQDAEREYLVGTTGSIFLFDVEIETFLNETLWHLAVELQTLEAELQGQPVGEVRSKNVKEQREIKDKLMKELRNLDTKFSKYLHLSH